MPPKAKIKPTKTLTQRRNGGDAPESNLNQPTRSSGLSNQNNFSSSPLENIAKNSNNEGSGGSVIKIIIWAIVILTVGIGLALIVRNMTKDKNTNSSKTTTTQTPDTTGTTGTDTTTGTGTTGTDTTGTSEDGATGTDTTTGTDDTTGTTTDTTTTDTTTTGSLTNAYSHANQTISDGTTGSVITVTGYTYSNFSAYLEYKIKLGTVTTFPGATATIDTTAKTLTVVVSNVKTDKIVGNGKSGSTTFAGHPNASKVDISNSNHRTTFVFTLANVTDYKINAVKGTDFDSIVVTIKNR